MKRVLAGNLWTRLAKLEAQEPATEQQHRLFAEGTCAMMSHGESRFARCVLMHLKPENFVDWQLCGIIVNSTIEAVMLRLVERLEDRLAALATLPEVQQKGMKCAIARDRKTDSGGIDKLDKIGKITTPSEDFELVSAVSIFDHWQGREPGPEIYAEKFRAARDTLIRVGALCTSIQK
jgi:hypothetical protein